MKVSSEIKGIMVLMEGLEKDVEALERHGSKAGYGECFDGRPGATKTGVCNSISIIRRMLLQAEKNIKGE